MGTDLGTVRGPTPVLFFVVFVTKLSSAGRRPQFRKKRFGSVTFSVKHLKTGRYRDIKRPGNRQQEGLRHREPGEKFCARRVQKRITIRGPTSRHANVTGSIEGNFFFLQRTLRNMASVVLSMNFVPPYFYWLCQTRYYRSAQGFTFS